eukprot:CAMPEP_0119507266 /NCGR_PEP_ID=MMETSP1344-20130328/27208_1 /TAXON_ID=236787 /ORGANISM="Florenciella parvula, Strain CCMP2471" /LENGTH=465 /DNA_ID=CAMNT_0007543883 /DNA_START=64 /DNA_END=1458 /DNA_ORIENTATION=+
MGTPEEASDYLSRTNFKSVIEWLTAEAILNRPDDPMIFCRNLLDQKIDARGGVDYNAEHPTEYVRSCYAEASNLADEHGRIHGKVVAPVTTSSNQQMDILGKKLKILERLIVASRAIADSLDPYEATQAIIKESCSVLNADRASIFTVSLDKKSLQLMIAEGAKNITVPIGVGIAGGVATSGESVNIPDAYADDRFDPSHDKKTGYKTDSILCQPIQDTSGEIVGVMQVINKADGPFTPDDEEVSHILAAQAGIALKNAKSYRAQMAVQRKLRSVTDLVRGMNADMGTNSLIFTMTTKAPLIVDADRCTVFIVDEKQNQLVSTSGEVNIRIDLSKPTIAGSVATSGEIINIPDAYADDRFNPLVDKKTGYKTNTILCMPIKSKEKVVGVIQLINKEEGVFDGADEDLMGTFLDMAGPILLNSQLVGSKMNDEDQGTEIDGMKLRKKSTSKAPSMAGFAEGEGDEE